MATLNASKWGRLALTNQSSHANARDGTTANITSVNPTFQTANAIQYSYSLGRSGNVFSVYRVFYYFDTSGITGDVTNSTLNIRGGSSANSATFIIVPSTAFGGDGSADIVNTDFNNITFNTTYGAGTSGWSASGNNALAFKSNTSAESPANAAIRDNDYFICAVIEFTSDFSDSQPGSTGTTNNGINFSTTAYLDYDEAGAAGPANLTSYNGIAKASITNINGITMANITTLNGIS
tara:strand:+ start:529 stop:1239 length:711 start_codon:yes stop_codon:yes gene_type:complete